MHISIRFLAVLPFAWSFTLNISRSLTSLPLPSNLQPTHLPTLLFSHPHRCCVHTCAQVRYDDGDCEVLLLATETIQVPSKDLGGIRPRPSQQQLEAVAAMLLKAAEEKLQAAQPAGAAPPRRGAARVPTSVQNEGGLTAELVWSCIAFAHVCMVAPMVSCVVSLMRRWGGYTLGREGQDGWSQSGLSQNT